MTELQAGFAILLITLVLTIVWAAMMLHQDLNHIWSANVEIRELLKERNNWKSQMDMFGYNADGTKKNEGGQFTPNDG